MKFKIIKILKRHITNEHTAFTKCVAIEVLTTSCAIYVSVTMNDSKSLLVSVQELNRQFANFQEPVDGCLWSRISHWIESLKSSFHQRGPSSSQELIQEIWKLRRNLWKLAQTPTGDKGLLLTIWELQSLCDELNLFADFFEGVSAQYKLVKQMIEQDFIQDAAIRSLKLYLQITRRLNRQPNSTELEVVDGVKYYGNQKATQIVVAVSLAILTCASKSFEFDSLRGYIVVTRSLELWIRRSNQINNFKSHLSSAVYHVEKILCLIGSRFDKRESAVSKLVQSYCRICQLGGLSTNHGISVLVSGLPDHSLTPVSWSCFSILCLEQEQDAGYPLEGLRLMNGLFQRFLKLQKDDRVNPVGRFLKEVFTLNSEKLLLIPGWFTVHLSIALMLQMASCGEIPLLQKHISILQDSLENYNQFLNKISASENLQMTLYFTALGLLSYAIRSEQKTGHFWSNEDQIIQFVSGVMISTGQCLTSLSRKTLMESITAQKLPGYLSQYISALIRICPVFKDCRNLWNLINIFLDCLPDSVDLTTTGYRTLPRDLRIILDSVLEVIYLMKSQYSIPELQDLYSFSIELYFHVQQNWVVKERGQDRCLYSKIVDTVFQYSRQVLKSEQYCLLGVQFLNRVIPQILDSFPDPPMEDLKKLVNLYTRFSVQNLNSSQNERPCYSWLFYRVPYEQETTALKVFSQEVISLMKYSKTVGIDLQKLHHLKGYYFSQAGSPRNGGSRTGQIRMKALFVALLGYINSMELEQVLGILKDCQRSLETCPGSEVFLKETKALCLALQFLFSGLCGVQKDSTGDLDGMMMDVDGIQWAEGNQIIDSLELWHRILASEESVLDPDLTVMILTQCRALLQSRAWIHLEKALECLLLQLCKKHNEQISESGLKACQESFVIPFLPLKESIEELERNLDSLSKDDASSRSFQKKITVQLNLAVKYREQGCLEKAKEVTLDCRRFALGLYQSLWPKPVQQGSSNPSSDAQNFTNGEAWIAQGLYCFCLLFLARLLTEGDELDEARFVLKEAFHLVLILRSRELFCLFQIIQSEIFLRIDRRERTESHLKVAMDCIKTVLSDQQYCNGAIFPVYLLSRILQIQDRFQGTVKNRIQSMDDLRPLLVVNNYSAMLKQDRIFLKVSRAILNNHLNLQSALEWIPDYLESVSVNSICKFEFWKFLSFVSRWKDAFSPTCVHGVTVFGLEDLTDRFRQSLGINEGIQNRPKLEFRLKQLNSADPDLQGVFRILDCFLQDPIGDNQLQFRILLLISAWNGSQECSWLLEEIGKQLGVILAQAGYLNAAAYFLICSQGNSVRLQTLSNLKRRFQTVQEIAKFNQSLKQESFQNSPHFSVLSNLDQECRERLNGMIQELENDDLVVVCVVQVPGLLFMDWLGGELVLVRYTANQAPLIIAIPKILQLKKSILDETGPSSQSFAEILAEMSKILEDSKTGFENLKIEETVLDKRSHLENWWRERVKFDQQLKQKIQFVESALGPWKLLFTGNEPPGEDPLRAVKAFLSKILTPASWTGTLLELTRIFIKGLDKLNEDDLLSLAEFYSQRTESMVHMDEIYAILKTLKRTLNTRESQNKDDRICMTVVRRPRKGHHRRSSFRKDSSASVCFQSNLDKDVDSMEDGLDPFPVLLVLDYQLEQFPWESFGCFRNQSFYRIPNLHFARYLHLLRTHQTDSFQSDHPFVRFYCKFFVF